MVRNRWAVAAMIGTLLVATGVSLAATADKADLAAMIEELRQRVAEQDRKISELEARQNQEQLQKVRHTEILKVLKEGNVDAQRRGNDFRVYWKEGIRMDSWDGDFKLKLGGRLMADFGWIDGSAIEGDLMTDLEDGAEFRRARLYAAGDIYKELAFKLQFDFAGGHAAAKDIYLKFKKVPVAGNVTVGHFKEPFSLEELTSSKYITFMERALPNAFAPGRNMGIMANDTLCDKRATWAVGLFRPNSGNFGDDDTDGESALTARATALPWYEDKGRRLAHVGVSYSFRNFEDDLQYRSRPEAHWIPQYFSDTGAFRADDVNLFGAEAAVVYGPFSVQGEFIGAAIDSGEAGDPCVCGFYVQASYFLTGEHRNYKTSTGTFSRVKPTRNFREDGGWGAWEVAVRHSYLDLDDSDLAYTARTLNNSTIGLNWYLNPNVRLMWNYIRSCADGMDTSNAADIFMTRVQVDF